ncbi:winged helix-turn-helix domain-containing protein [Halovenus sp. HT40]|uniref:winged helix-turn-helix domain-containing protein n=1 Tax=Halovenus sp. HT40 TaxID=3126691 RepID=UPI00300F35EB
MVYYSLGDEQPPELETVLDALYDDSCRTIIQTLTEPMTVEEITEATEIPQSTTYQKIEKLSEAGLVAEGVERRLDGECVSQYAVTFGEINVELTEQMSFEIDVSHKPQSADEQLIELWSAVRNET